MAGVVVVGAQWGDEGKGKIVDWLSTAPMSSCGSRAGTMPGTRSSSATRPSSCTCCPPASCAGKLSVIGNGVVVDPWQLLDEVAGMNREGVRSMTMT